MAAAIDALHREDCKRIARARRCGAGKRIHSTNVQNILSINTGLGKGLQLLCKRKKWNESGEHMKFTVLHEPQGIGKDFIVGALLVLVLTGCAAPKEKMGASAESYPFHFSPTFSPDGKHLAVVNQLKNSAVVFDVATRREISHFRPNEVKGYRGASRKVVFTPDGNLVAAFIRHGQIGIWDVSASNCLVRLKCLAHPLGHPLSMRLLSIQARDLAPVVGHL